LGQSLCRGGFTIVQFRSYSFIFVVSMADSIVKIDNRKQYNLWLCWLPDKPAATLVPAAAPEVYTLNPRKQVTKEITVKQEVKEESENPYPRRRAPPNDGHATKTSRGGLVRTLHRYPP